MQAIDCGMATILPLPGGMTGRGSGQSLSSERCVRLRWADERGQPAVGVVRGSLFPTCAGKLRGFSLLFYFRSLARVRFTNQP